MLKVDQTIVAKGDGDCLRACIASLFDLTIEQVPHFNRWGDTEWFPVMCSFIQSIGWDYRYHWTDPSIMNESNSVGGYILGTVPGITDPEDADHAVIIDLKGVVVHDPHPSKKYQDVNVIETKQLKYIEIIERAS